MTEEFETIAALTREVGLLKDAIKDFRRDEAEIKTALNILNSSLIRIEESTRNTLVASLIRIEESTRNTLVAIGALRKDVEHIQKNGCTMRCPPPDDAEQTPIPLRAAR